MVIYRLESCLLEDAWLMDGLGSRNPFLRIGIETVKVSASN